MVDGSINGILNALIAFAVVFAIGILMDYPEQKRKQNIKKSK